MLNRVFVLRGKNVGGNAEFNAGFVPFGTEPLFFTAGNKLKYEGLRRFAQPPRRKKKAAYKLLDGQTI